MSKAKPTFVDFPVGKIFRNADSFFIVRALGYDIVKEEGEFVPGEVKTVLFLQMPRGVEFWNSVEKVKNAIKEERLVEFTPTQIYVED
jgi:hypothetical protein